MTLFKRKKELKRNQSNYDMEKESIESELRDYLVRVKAKDVTPNYTNIENKYERDYLESILFAMEQFRNLTFGDFTKNREKSTNSNPMYEIKQAVVNRINPNNYRLIGQTLSTHVYSRACFYNTDSSGSVTDNVILSNMKVSDYPEDCLTYHFFMKDYSNKYQGHIMWGKYFNQVFQTNLPIIFSQKECLDAIYSKQTDITMSAKDAIMSEHVFEKTFTLIIKYQTLLRTDRDMFNYSVTNQEAELFKQSVLKNLENLTIDYATIRDFIIMFHDKSFYEKILNFITLVESSDFNLLPTTDKEELYQEYMGKIYFRENAELSKSKKENIKELLDILVD